MNSRLTVRRRTPRWLRTKCLTSILGAATLLATVGWGSVFAADPLATADDPAPVAQEVVVDEQAAPVLVTEDPAADADDPAEVIVPPVQAPSTGQQTPAAGSIKWCPITTMRYPLPLSCRMPLPPIVVTVPGVQAPGAGQETRPDGSVWWCPATTGRFLLRLPCRMILPPSDVIVPPVPTPLCPPTAGHVQMRLWCLTTAPVARGISGGATATGRVIVARVLPVFGTATTPRAIEWGLAERREMSSAR